eukprot:TRINITY_DN3734_c0_g1_i1.p1 TRINITY_DN3734_c0_g1~~TRINITY_DN3734_c0_g1_i1.p1  ORF type:complete len:607 (+),score=126.44 TRINITY_DN3734_c0_g1_i1:130-1950(+)
MRTDVPAHQGSQRCAPGKGCFAAGVGCGFVALTVIIARAPAGRSDHEPPAPQPEQQQQQQAVETATPKAVAVRPVASSVPASAPLPAVAAVAPAEGGAPDWGLPQFRQPEVRWADAARLRDPQRPQRPSLFTNLTVGLLRGLSAGSAAFWARNPWGRVRVHLGRLPPGVHGAGTSWRTKVLRWLPPALAAPTLQSDFAVVLRFSELAPESRYGWAMALELNGTWHHHAAGTLRTFPAEGSLISAAEPLLFGFGSCINPTDRGPTGRSLELLARWDPALRFFFFIGDFIYFWDELPHELPEYLRFYYRKLATAEVLAAMRAVPFFFQYDDHEVHNDYASGGNPRKHPWHRPAMQAWDWMIAQANPPPPPEVPSAERDLARWYTVSYGNAQFFVADVRSYKVPTKDLTGGLLGEHQLAALRLWLQTRCRRSQLSWCFLVSPTIFSHGSYRADLWYGHMLEQAKVRGWFTERGTAPVTVLSGDSHIPGVWELAGPEVLEFTCSPVDAFGLLYPWQMPPAYAPRPRGRKGRSSPRQEEWPALGNLPPPKILYLGRPRHLGPAGYNCLVQVNATAAAQGKGGTVAARLDVIDGHAEGGRLLFTHTLSYTQP